MDKHFQISTFRVKGLSFHPSRPWILASLHEGTIELWDYNMKILIAKFDDHKNPVRGIDFHPHLPLFVSGGDQGDVRVWNYKQKRCTFVLKGHIDYIRTTFFHKELPWILSSSDDQTVRIWNYQSRSCINIITGHSHYVRCAQFHPSKDYIVSCSMDATIRIWDFSILRKRLTESKSGSSLIGIEIECIKVLEGHERGVYWVAFHATQNLIVSASDDSKIKLWKYTDEVAWEHSTIEGHTSTVTCCAFDPVTDDLITSSEDQTFRMWKYYMKKQVKSVKHNKCRYWVLSVKQNGSLLAAGHDKGFEIYQLNKQIVPYALITKELIVFAEGMTTSLYDIPNKKKKPELHQYKPKNKDSQVFIQDIKANPFEQNVFMIQINEEGERIFIIKKKENYLNFPTVIQHYSALDSCFISKKGIATLVNHHQIKFSTYGQTGTSRNLKVNDSICIEKIFNTNRENQVIFVTENTITKYNTTQRKRMGQETFQNTKITNIAHGEDGKIAAMGQFTIIILNKDFVEMTTIEEKFPVRSAFWESGEILFYTTNNHWKFALMNGETGVLKTIEEPLYLLRKLPNNKFVAFSERQKVFQINCQQYREIQFKVALNEQNWERVRDILSKSKGTDKKILIKYLVSKGHSSMALDLVSKHEEKFALAIQSSDFHLALQICNQNNTQEYWEMLGEEALKQGIFEAYDFSCKKLKKFSELNFLYSLQNNTKELQKLCKLAKKTKNPILGFNSATFLNDRDQMEELLREHGFEKLAELASEASQEQGDKSEILKRLGSRPLSLVEPVGQDNTANWPHNVEEQNEEDD